MTDLEVTLHRFFRAVDQRRWDVVAATLDDEVELDYSSLFGGGPERVPGPEVVERWAGMLPGFDATQHLVGPLLVDGDTVACNVRGYHHLDGETWLAAGWYTISVRGTGPVRISGIRLELSYEEGPRSLVDRARQRVSG